MRNGLPPLQPHILLQLRGEFIPGIFIRDSTTHDHDWTGIYIVNMYFSRKLSELGSRLDFGVQGLGRVLGAAAGQKWSFRVRRMSISSGDGVPVLS